MQSLTPSQKIWKKFKRNKLAVAGLGFILFMVLMGVLGYHVCTDKSPYANTMYLQLSNKKPMRSFVFFKTEKLSNVEKKGFFHTLLFGQELDYRAMPITDYRFSSDSLFVKEYIGDDELAEESGYSILEVSGKTTISDKDKEDFLQEHVFKQTFYFGTDIYGRDLYSRLILGVRVSLSVGLMAVAISLFIGLSLGAIAGYFGGKIDAAISWFMNVIWALPSLLLVIAISFALGKGFWQIFIAVGLSTWVDVARLVRGQVMALKQVEYVEAAKVLGYSSSRTIIKHLLPNMAGPILVVASANFASAILLETGLSFLGFGAQPPMPSWGSMIKEHYAYIIMDAAYLAILPGLAIMLTVYAFNVLAIGLRDAFDVKGQHTNV
ncbi:MAG: ABC transporter permease [Pedobacter sp.]|nr:MAG: ABC transporter permease [Pedobacter sp.]